MKYFILFCTVLAPFLGFEALLLYCIIVPMLFYPSDANKRESYVAKHVMLVIAGVAVALHLGLL